MSLAQSPAVTLTATSEEVLVGETARFEATVHAAASTGIEWYVDGVPAAQGSSATLRFDQPGLVDVEVRVALASGATISTGTIVSVFPTSGASAIGFGDPPAMAGDVDGDSAVTIRDALVVRRFLDGDYALGAVSDLDAGDLNLNGRVDEDDVHLIQQMVHGQASVPVAIRPESGHPGTFVQLISPALGTVGGGLAVRFGNTPPIEVFRPRLGYANCVAPRELTAELPPDGSAASVPVEVLVDGVVVETFGFEASRVPAGTRPAAEALVATPTALCESIEMAMDALGTALPALSAGPEEVAALQSVLAGSLLYAERSLAAMEAFVAGSTPEQQAFVYEVMRANGIDEYLDAMASVQGTPQAASFARTPSTAARVVLSAICALQGAKEQLEVPAKALSATCLVVGGFTILFPPSATVTATVVGACTGVFAAIGIVDLVLAFVPAVPSGLDVKAEPNRLMPGETAEISITYSLGIGSAICSGVFEGLVQSLAKKLGTVVAGLAGARRQAWELAKSWPVGSTTGNLVKELTDLVTEFFTEAVGLVGSIQLISTKLQAFQQAVCNLAPGATTFELEPGVALAAIPSPPDAGTIVVPPVGSTARATFTCDPDSMATMPVTVTLDASFFAGCTVSGQGTVTCGGAGDVRICQGDNGSLLDDIFELTFDGQTYVPSAPVRNLCTPTLTVPAGTYTATLSGRAAPDGIGTYFISFDGVTNLSGPPLSGSNLVPGTTFSWIFDVEPATQP